MRGSTHANATPSRWIILKVLAEATGPLDFRQLVKRADILPATARNALVRPRRAAWIETEAIPAVQGSSGGIKHLYTITEAGRKALAEHQKETTP